MSSRAITPISQVSQGRPQEMGKIKIGAVVTKNGKSRPTTLDTFRFVSRDHAAVATLAEILGGTPKMVEGKSDLISEASEIDVILAPDCLGESPVYELWSGGGCQRRCDGVTVTVPIREGEDVNFTDQHCICAGRGEMECKPTTRLSVILPFVTLGGVWNLSTNSWAAAREMPQMVSTIEQAQHRGFIAAKLGIEKRKQVSAGKTKNFGVPVLRLNTTLSELASGSSLPALTIARPDMAALPAPEPHLGLTPEQRAPLTAAWEKADESSKAEMVSWMKNYGVTKETLRPEMVQDLLDILTIVEADVY
jgi:hypothetical protein